MNSEHNKRAQAELDWINEGMPSNEERFEELNNFFGDYEKAGRFDGDIDLLWREYIHLAYLLCRVIKVENYWPYFHELDCDDEFYGEPQRWTRTHVKIWNYNDVCLGLFIDEGLTECQDDDPWDQVPLRYMKVNKIITCYELVK